MLCAWYQEGDVKQRKHLKHVPPPTQLPLWFNHTARRVSCSGSVLHLEVLLRAGFVASMPGTPEFCPRKDTPQVVHCDDGRISTRGKSLPIFSH
jgi:hypothetical protein